MWKLFLLLLPALAFSANEKKIKAVYNSLDPSSVAEHLAFYELYPESVEGKQALQDAWGLMSDQTDAAPIPSIPTTINAIVSLVNKQPNQEIPTLKEEELQVIERLASRLPNRKLKGNGVAKEEEVLALKTEEVDLARALFLTEMDSLEKIRSYEAMIDLMALQILARLPKEATPKQKVRFINTYIFEELGFRFPPHSLMAKDVDLYTFLPSVLDSRHGVCLGVSILYLALADRLDLNLQVITPPGHIYVRLNEGGAITNIETTARGIHIDCEEYLGIDTRSLQLRTKKEVVGLSHMNAAAASWHNDEYEKALASYSIAQRYLPDDLLLKEFMAYNYLLSGEKEKGEAYLLEVKDHVHDYAVAKETIAEDYLNGKVEAEGISPVFMSVDETRESIVKKRDALLSTLEKFPTFRAGLFSLAISWLQLHRQDEALQILKRYHELDPTNPTVEYYLTILLAERLDFTDAWVHLKQAEILVKERNHAPKALKELKRALNHIFPK